ncbi:MAG: methylenetetrahydrofolate reductase [NAD(P)H] [Christensenellales bacterium]|jgi:methylenetetrahydrofolate reductase (NADPH)
MRISDLLKTPGVKLSVEVFPPKAGADYAKVQSAIDELCALKPAFLSVTYGAGGTTAANTARIASYVQRERGVTSLAHLTCVGASREHIRTQLQELREGGVQNILALRGDIPDGARFPFAGGFRYASDLVTFIKEEPGFCIGCACYPEGHVESANREDDIDHLKIKVDAGAEFLTTQMFFDNNILYNFLYRLREKGVVVPVIPGIMPVTNAKQIQRICALSGTVLPRRFKAIVERFGGSPAAMAQAGIAYATEQIIDLIANGINAIHLYSMNRPEVARSILNNLSEIIGDKL